MGRRRLEQREIGKQLREKTPRSSHSGWKPDANRPDPLQLLQQQDAGRIPQLIPIKYGRMLASPFAFLRGSAAVMAADLASTPVSSIDVMLCGDAHLSNFGFFASRERNLLFDLNDFDECYPGPWEWDLKRLGASIVVAGRDIGLSDKTSADITAKMVEVYRKAMHQFDEMSTLDVWYSHVDAETLMKIYDKKASKQAIEQTEETIEKAMSTTQTQTVEKLTALQDGQRYFKYKPPLLVPMQGELIYQHFSENDLAGVTDEVIKHTWREYLKSLEEDQRFLLSRYHVVDVALRVGGVGSVGTRCFIVLLHGEGHDDSIILQLKEAGDSALAPYLPAHRRYANGARRIVIGQRLISAASDSFLGWHKNIAKTRQFYWRQLKDMKGSFDVTDMDRSAFETYTHVCALCLARAHARTGDEGVIAGYLGRNDKFAGYVADFAIRYADQTEQDYQALVQAVKSGRIQAETGI